jgi:hypothetical protein
VGGKIKLTGILAFFFGFPGVGLLLFWAHMHSTMERSADARAAEVSRQMLGLEPLAVPVADGLLSNDVAAARDRAVALRAQGAKPEGPPRITSSWAVEDPARDMRYLYVKAVQPLADGRGELRFTLERPSREDSRGRGPAPGWRLLEFNYSDVKPAR